MKPESTEEFCQVKTHCFNHLAVGVFPVATLARATPTLAIKLSMVTIYCFI